MEQITFTVDENKTLFSCGCETEVIGENFVISPCSLDCEVYKYCIEQSKKQGSIIMYNIEKEHT